MTAGVLDAAGRFAATSAAKKAAGHEFDPTGDAAGTAGAALATRSSRAWASKLASRINGKPGLTGLAGSGTSWAVRRLPALGAYKALYEALRSTPLNVGEEQFIRDQDIRRSIDETVRDYLADLDAREAEAHSRQFGDTVSPGNWGMHGWGGDKDLRPSYSETQLKGGSLRDDVSVAERDSIGLDSNSGFDTRGWGSGYRDSNIQDASGQTGGNAGYRGPSWDNSGEFSPGGRFDVGSSSRMEPRIGGPGEAARAVSPYALHMAQVLKAGNGNADSLPLGRVFEPRLIARILAAG